MTDNKKFNLEDALCDIQREEVLPLGGSLSTEQMRRIEDKVFSELHEEEGFTKKSSKEESFSVAIPFKKKRFTRRVAVVLAAAVIAAVGITAGATKGVWNFDLVGFSGISNQNIDALDGSQAEIGATTTATLIDYSKSADGEAVDVTFTITDSFGDSQHQFIEITTDYPAPEGFDPTKDTITSRASHFEAKQGAEEEGVMGGSMDEEIIVRDGMLVIQYFIREDYTPINQADMALYFEDLYLCKDAIIQHNGELDRDYRKGELLLAGSWDLQWTNDYVAETVSYIPEDTITIGEFEVQIDEVIVSELGIRWMGHTLCGELDNSQMDALGEALQIGDRYQSDDATIVTYVDGTNVVADHFASLGFTNKGELNFHVSFKPAGTVLDLENVKSLTFGDVEIVVQ